MPTCIFCNNPSGSREHVWPKWILERKDLGPFRLKIGNGQEKVIDVELQVKTVCGKCNNGWMSDLEAEAKPILEQMFDDKPISLDQKQQEIIARWLMKTAMVYDSVKGRAAPNLFYRKDECVALREHGHIPQPTMMWIGRLDEVHRSIWGMDFTRQSDEGQINCTVVTLTNENFVAQVVSLHLPRTPTATTKIPMEPKYGELDSSLSQLWPPKTSALTWPPATSFTNGGVNGYAYLLDRWRIGTESDGPILPSAETE
jgi:hypothetical protein